MCVRVRFACAMHARVLRGSKYNSGMQRNAFQLFLVEPIRKYTHCGLNIAGDMRVNARGGTRAISSDERNMQKCPQTCSSEWYDT